MTTHRAAPLTLRRLAATGLALAATGTFAATLAPHAEAIVLTTGAQGLEIREPNTNSQVEVTVALVDEAGVTKYRVSRRVIGGRRIAAGPGCVASPESNSGFDIAICDRLFPAVDVSLSARDDTFEVDPSFPDPIRVFGGLGSDRIVLGAGDDIADGGGGQGDQIFGNGGNDTLTSGSGRNRLEGGPGNDRLIASPGSITTIVGGEGDDVIVAERSSRGLMAGGPGRDAFEVAGSQATVDARDGVAESVDCGLQSASTQALLGGGPTAVVDLVDTPGDISMITGGCEAVDRAPRGETTRVQIASKTARISGRRVALRVRCTTTRRCKGTAAVRVGTVNGRSVRYDIPGKRTTTVRAIVSSAVARRVASRGTVAVALVREKGAKGPRTDRSRVTVRR
jgi:hypothetical protein